MIDFTDLKARLSPPVKRETLIEIMANGLNIPDMVKVTAYLLVNRMHQPELDNMGQLAIKAITIFEAGDMQGLEKFLIDHKIPPQGIKAIMGYASHIAKIQ